MNNIHDASQPLDSRQLLAFATLVKTGSFTLTGKGLFLSQSAVSHAMKALENDIGCRLFDRVGKKVHPTPAGEHLLHYVERILSDMTAAREAINQLSTWGKGRLRIGASASISQFVFPKVLPGFQKEYPQWSVSVELADTRECVELLRQGRIDLAVAIAPHRAEAVELVPLFSDELSWIVPPGHLWAQRGAARSEEIASQKLIVHSAASYTFHLLEKYLDRDGVRPNLNLELGHPEAVKEMVKHGAGVTALATWTVRRELEEGSLAAVPLGKRKLRRNWCVLRSLDRIPGLAAEAFVKACLAATKALNIDA